MSNHPRTDLKKARVRKSAERQVAWKKLTPQQQLDALDKRLGKDVGAAKQRARLRFLIEKMKHQPKSEPNGDEPVDQLIASEEGGRIKAKERRAAERAKRPSK